MHAQHISAYEETAMIISRMTPSSLFGDVPGGGRRRRRRRGARMLSLLPCLLLALLSDATAAEERARTGLRRRATAADDDGSSPTADGPSPSDDDESPGSEETTAAAAPETQLRGGGGDPSTSSGVGGALFAFGEEWTDMTWIDTEETEEAEEAERPDGERALGKDKNNKKKKDKNKDKKDKDKEQQQQAAPAPAPQSSSQQGSSQQSSAQQSSSQGVVSYSSGGGGCDGVLSTGKTITTISYGGVFNVRNKSGSSILVKGLDFHTGTKSSVGYTVYTRSGSWKGTLGVGTKWTVVACGTAAWGSTLKSIPASAFKTVTIAGNGGTRAFYVALDQRTLIGKRGASTTQVGRSTNELELYGGLAHKQETMPSDEDDYSDNVLFQGNIRYAKRSGTSCWQTSQGSSSCQSKMPAKAVVKSPCDVSAEVTCTGPGGHRCDARSSGNTCTDRPTSITFTYVGTECWESTDNQGGALKCRYKHEPVWGRNQIKVTVNDERGFLYLAAKKVSLGQSFTIQAYEGAPYNGKLSEHLSFLVQPASGDPIGIQYVVLNTYCQGTTSTFSVGDQYGAFKVDGFSTERQGIVPAPRWSTHTYRYKITNDGGQAASLVTAQATRNGSTQNLVSSGYNLSKGKSVTVTKTYTVDTTQRSNYVTTLNVGANANGNVCFSSATHSLAIVP